MPIVKITGQGLSAIALSVALLWGCWMEQHALQRRDQIARARVLRDLEMLRTRQPQPASTPIPNRDLQFSASPRLRV